VELDLDGKRLIITPTLAGSYSLAERLDSITDENLHGAMDTGGPVVLSPGSYNERVGLAIFCPVISLAKGYPFEVDLPSGGGGSGMRVGQGGHVGFLLTFPPYGVVNPATKGGAVFFADFSPL